MTQIQPRHSTTPLRVVACSLATLMIAVTPAGAQNRSNPGDATWQWTGTVNASETVVVRAASGEVRVIAATGNSAVVRGRKEPRPGSERADTRTIFEMRKEGEVTLICAYDPERGDCEVDGLRQSNRDRSDRERNTRIFLDVELPRGIRLVVATGNGPVTVTGTESDARISSGNGRITIERVAGSIKASTGNGAVSVTDVRGPVTVHSGNGDIRVSTATGAVSAHTGNGSIDVTMRKVTGAEDMEFSSGNGRVTLHIPEGMNAEVDAHTGNGSFSSDFPLVVQGRMSKHRMRATLGTGGQRVKISTGNGSVSLRKAETGSGD